MNNDAKSNNARLRELVAAVGLPEPVALTIFNRGLGVRACSVSTWKAYLANEDSVRFASFEDDLLAHAKKVFAQVVAKV